ncbi:hypothetical protein ABT093_05890 [Kitasatospora sp. NPDC002551]|uniref:hypothetical protein n=1 Tax=unclassified Kitasatospora TaxID=2633591 RepID=UPI00332F0CDB
MDHVLELARTAGPAVTGLLLGTSWQRVRDGIVELWQQAAPEQGEAIGAALDTARQVLVAAQEQGDDGAATRTGQEWEQRFTYLLARNPELADRLRALLATERPVPATGPVVGGRAQYAHVTGGGSAYIAGGDITITK